MVIKEYNKGCGKDIYVRETAQIKLGLWMYNRGFIGLIILAFDFLFNDGEKVSNKIYEEIFAKRGAKA